MDIEIIDKREKPEELIIADYLIGKGIYNLSQLREIFEASYVLIPVEILKRKDLDSTAKIIYAEIKYLSRRKGFCYATNEHLAEKTGLSKRTIPRILNRLSKLKLISIELKKNSKGTFRKIFTGGMTNSDTGVRSEAIRATLRSDAKRESNKRNIQKEHNIIKNSPVENVDPEGLERYRRLKAQLGDKLQMAAAWERTKAQEEAAAEIRPSGRPQIT